VYEVLKEEFSDTNVFWMGDFNPRLRLPREHCSDQESDDTENIRDIKFATKAFRDTLIDMVLNGDVDYKQQEIEKEIDTFELGWFSDHKEIKSDMKQYEKLMLKEVSDGLILEKPEKRMDRMKYLVDTFDYLRKFIETELCDFKEANDIRFAPTYRFDKKSTHGKGTLTSDDYKNGNKKGNVLSWTDRVFFKALEGYEIKNTDYDGLFEISGSDHKPVTASFEVWSPTPTGPINTTSNATSHNTMFTVTTPETGNWKVVNRRLASTPMQRLLNEIHAAQ